MGKTSKAMDRIMEVYNTKNSVETKDFTLKAAFEIGEKQRPYQEKDGTVLLPVTGFHSVFVEKYANDNCQGYHTMVYLEGGIKTGGFSNALLKIANFFYLIGGVPLTDSAKVIFDKPMYIRVAKAPFDGLDKEGKQIQKSTYNFDIVGGETESMKFLQSAEQYTNLIPSSDYIEVPLITDGISTIDPEQPLDLPESDEIPAPKKAKK